MDQEAELIVGTYEDYIVGYRHEQTSLDQTFALRGHSGSVRALACSPNGCLVLSAGHDDMINLINMKKRKLVCTLESSITCAAFVGNSHVVCGSEDGNIYIYECKQDVALVKTLTGHKGPVTAIDVHPTNKVLVSLSKDETMRTWNLIKGRRAYITKTNKKDPHLIKWSETGSELIIVSTNSIHLYNRMGHQADTCIVDRRINHIEFLTDSCFVVASDSGKLDFFCLKQNGDINDVKLEHLFKFEAHTSRIKAVKCLGEIDMKQSIRFATASSDGQLRTWSCKTDKDLRVIDQPKLNSEVETGARLTCMTASIVKSSIVKFTSKDNAPE